MKALFITLCGCTQWIDVSEPQPSIWRVAIIRKLKTAYTDGDRPCKLTQSYREFERTGFNEYTEKETK